MPSGATLFGDNRFALLSETRSPRAKKKKQSAVIQFEEFPELNTNKINVKNPKFVVVSSASNDTPLSNYSCFAIYRSLQTISKDIVSISQLRDGSLLLLVNSDSIANKFLNTKELVGICKVKCSLHEKLNITKGTVYAPYLNNVSEEEIVRELKSQGVVAVYKFTKLNEGKKVPNGVLLLDFDLYSLPSKIDICWHSVKVKQYFPTPMRCKNCQLLGHTQKFCKNATSCVGCNLPPHSPDKCTRKYCANCAENHAADDKECKKFLQQKHILTIKTQKKCSLKEAQKLYQQQQPFSTNNSNSYSAVVNQLSVINTNKDTVQTTTQQLQLETPTSFDFNQIKAKSPTTVSIDISNKNKNNLSLSSKNKPTSSSTALQASNYKTLHTNYPASLMTDNSNKNNSKQSYSSQNYHLPISTDLQATNYEPLYKTDITSNNDMDLDLDMESNDNINALKSTITSNTSSPKSSQSIADTASILSQSWHTLNDFSSEEESQLNKN